MAEAVYFKVDVDTYLGMKNGVPNLLELFRKLKVKATFFLSFGPDKSGRAIFNIWRRKGFLKKMLRTGAPSLYGFKTMFYGTVIPAPMIAVQFPDIVKRIEEEGHEVGVHAWNHRLWQDHLDELPPDKIRSEFNKAFEAYERILEHPPRSTAAPAWYCSGASLAVQDGLGLDYCSDVRGEYPFIPVLGGKEHTTLQIPTTMTCLEEVLGRMSENDLVENFNGELRKDNPNIFPVHAEVEGKRYLNLFRKWLVGILERGMAGLPLHALYEQIDTSSVRRCRILYQDIPGRSGLVAVQETGNLN